jgi:hypothetical protein
MNDSSSQRSVDIQDAFAEQVNDSPHNLLNKNNIANYSYRHINGHQG